MSSERAGHCGRGMMAERTRGCARGRLPKPVVRKGHEEKGRLSLTPLCHVLRAPVRQVYDTVSHQPIRMLRRHEAARAPQPAAAAAAAATAAMSAAHRGTSAAKAGAPASAAAVAAASGPLAGLARCSLLFAPDSHLYVAWPDTILVRNCRALQGGTYMDKLQTGDGSNRGGRVSATLLCRAESICIYMWVAGQPAAAALALPRVRTTYVRACYAVLRPRVHPHVLPSRFLPSRRKLYNAVHCRTTGGPHHVVREQRGRAVAPGGAGAAAEERRGGAGGCGCGCGLAAAPASPSRDFAAAAAVGVWVSRSIHPH